MNCDRPLLPIHLHVSSRLKYGIIGHYTFGPRHPLESVMYYTNKDYKFLIDNNLIIITTIMSLVLL